MTRVFLKLAFAGVGRRRLQTAITVLVVAVAAATLTIALGVGRVADRPWERTFEATNAPHVTVLGNDRDLAPFTRLAGVVDSTGVRTVAFTAFERDGETFGLRLVGADPSSRVGRPLVVEGSEPGPGEVLLERSFARFHGLDPGDRITVADTPLAVSGVAVISQAEPYPRDQPGIAFATSETIDRVAPDPRTRHFLLGLRLADREATEALAEAATPLLGTGIELAFWQEDRADATESLRGIRVVLSMFGAMLLLAGGAVLATLIGGRVLAQQRELGVLKAAGLTPGQVARVVLLEQAGLGLVGVALGIALGTAAAPLFVSEGASLLNASETPPLTATGALLVAGVTLAVVVLFTYVPALRAGRRSTATLLTDAPAGRPHGSRLGRLAERLGAGVPATIGARGAFVRPGRAAATTLALAVTVAACVATLGMEASLRVATDPPPAPPLVEGSETPRWDPVDDDAGEAAQLRPVVYGLDVLLLFVGLVNLVATVLLTVRERVRDLGLLKAVGFTPRNVTTSFVTSQACLGALGALVGIPLGLALFRLGVQLAGGSGEFAYPWWWTLPILTAGAIAAVVVLSLPLARRASGIRVVDALRYE
jgi:putative ABC transport system permease protein